MFGGWAASLINLIEATVGAIILHIKEKRISSEQGVAGYGTQGVRRT
jgi:hypothetical protein